MKTTKATATPAIDGTLSPRALKTLRASLSPETVQALHFYSLEIGVARAFVGEAEAVKPVALDALVNMLMRDSRQLRFELLAEMWASLEESAGNTGFVEIVPSAPLWSVERLAGKV